MNILKSFFQKHNSPSQNNTFTNSNIEKKNILPYLGIIVAVFLVIVIINFPFNSWFTGWDNLHPEFNFRINFQRGFNAVWQTNQGLGTFGGHGYAATLLHTLFLFLLSVFLPIQYLRTTFTFLALIAGTFGVFFLIKKMLNNQNGQLVNMASCLGALFYMLNFATVENFYIQLEAFIVHYAVLPWLLLSAINYLETRNKKNLLIFMVITLVSSIQGFIPPLFFVYIMILSIYLCVYILSKLNITRIKNAAVLFIITLLINSYWLLPVIYYSLSHSTTYLNAYNNMTSTDDFILQNKKYGNIKDLVFLKGFIIDSMDTSANGKTISIFSIWQTHLSNTFVSVIGYLFFGIIIFGLIYLYKKKSNWYYLATLIGFIFIFSLLATNTLPFSLISAAFQKIPILHQAFRIAFTKFSISLAFFYSLGFGIGVFWILSMIIDLKIKKAVVIFFTLTLLYFALPTLQGNFLYKNTKINIPDIYFELFNYFKQQDPQTRIVNVPIGWHWGWSVYKWGYSGSGFLWYGIEQPIMDRAFDVWGKYNENYYWEISQAIYSNNFKLVDKLLEKYQINWLIFDKNVTPYPSSKSYIYSQDFEKYLNTSNKYRLVQTLKSKQAYVLDINIYQVKLDKQSFEYKAIKPVTELQNIGPLYEFTDYDQAYDGRGEYFTENKAVNYDIFFLNRTLFTKRTPVQNILIPNNLNLIYDSDTDLNFANHQPTSCGSSIFDIKQAKQNIISNNVLQFISQNTENCYTIVLDQLLHRKGYLIEIESKHIKGKDLQLAVINHQSQKTDIELTLNHQNNFQTEYVIIPPMQYYGLGYSLAFNNISIGDSESINELKSVKVYTYPYQTLLNTKIDYQADIIDRNQLLIYYQSFDPDWNAYIVNKGNVINKYLPFLFGNKLTKHILINNWANGWIISPSQLNQSESVKTGQITIIFWPQYLEYLGFGSMLVTFLFILFKFKDPK